MNSTDLGHQHKTIHDMSLCVLMDVVFRSITKAWSDVKLKINDNAITS